MSGEGWGRAGAGVVSVRGYILSWDIEVEEYVAIRPDGSYIPIPKIGRDWLGITRYQATVTYMEIEDGMQVKGDLRGVFYNIVKFDFECRVKLAEEAARKEREEYERAYNR